MTKTHFYILAVLLAALTSPAAPAHFQPGSDENVPVATVPDAGGTFGVLGLALLAVFAFDYFASNPSDKNSR